MQNERWSTEKEIQGTLKEGGSGIVLWEKNDKIYSFETEGHAQIIGASGTGKTRTLLVPSIMNVMKNKENAIIIDPKREIYKAVKDKIPGDYHVHLISFDEMYDKDSEGWNPLIAPYQLWESSNALDNHMAERMIEDLAYALFNNDNLKDPFWEQQAECLFLGVVYSIFKYAEPEEINLSSCHRFVSEGEDRRGSSTYIKKFLEIEKDDNIKMQLQSYCTTANDTRCGIFSTYFNCISFATRSKSVRDFLSHDELDINSLQGDDNTLIFITIPDETRIYDKLAGILTNQLIIHYIRQADQKFGGKLPIRQNLFLDELGNIGKSIPNLPHCLSAGRSRNIRVVYVLQSLSQLKDLYGECDAETIDSNSDIRIAFRINHYDTLLNLSKLCGRRISTRSNHVSEEQLITPAQLAAMDVGQALIMIKGKTKYITWLKDYSMIDILEDSGVPVHLRKGCREDEQSYFDIKRFVDDRIELNKELKGKLFNEEYDEQIHRIEANFLREPIDVDNLLADIDRKIMELEIEKLEEMNDGKRVNIKITKIADESGTAIALQKHLPNLTNVNIKKIIRAVTVDNHPYGIKGLKPSDVINLIYEFMEIGTTVEIVKSEGNK